MNQKAISLYLSQDSVKNSIKNVLGDNTEQFVASVASVVSGNKTLELVDRKSLLMACLTAASLNLPVNQNLGFTYVVPYKNKQGEQVAQLQIGYKGFIQLAMRSGQFKTINVSRVVEGEIVGRNYLTGEIEFDWQEDRISKKSIGYVAYMKLTSGFEKMYYMNIDDLNKHARKYSQTMKRGFGLWKDEFDAMASKTVLKLLLSKYAPLSTEMQRAQLADQAVVNGEDDFEYIDNKTISPGDEGEEKEMDRIVRFITKAKTVDELKECEKAVEGQTDVIKKIYSDRLKTLSK